MQLVVIVIVLFLLFGGGGYYGYQGGYYGGGGLGIFGIVLLVLVVGAIFGRSRFGLRVSQPRLGPAAKP